MTREQFCKSPNVQEFIKWLSERMDQENSFLHRYVSIKSKKDWMCHSIYSAYENYTWNFSCIDKIGTKIKGSSFLESKRVLDGISKDLQESLSNGNDADCLSSCRQILEWGGVTHKNLEKIRLMEKRCDYFKEAINIFETENDLEYYSNAKLLMNSGFTKIYSLIVRDFVIYDSRVGAALGLFVRNFCEDTDRVKIPDELRFAWGDKRQGSSCNSNNMKNPRNPSYNDYKFPKLMYNNKLHINNNIRANWLLKETLQRTKSKFNLLEERDALRALESALFMIGYEVVAQNG